MDEKLEDLENANIVLKSINRAAMAVALNKTCCGNCAHIWEPSCLYPNNFTASSVCKNHKYDGKTYNERMIKDQANEQE